MAVGIDKIVHKRLIDGLSRLSTDETEAIYWNSVSMDLQEAYNDAVQLLRLTEIAALRYNEIQASTRTKVAGELRSRKRIKS
ncbi:MAG: hypothetical protein EOO42_05185 [Flavobacteriales bacterium]|nr:MAG: hypothetical protein EOO42_05185 [Flavobacteriales bacterium]